MDNDSELLDRIIVFLIVLISIILIFSQYQYFMISQSYWVYVSVALILSLVGLIAWIFIEGKMHKSHHEHLTHEYFTHAKNEYKPFTFMEKATYGLVAVAAVLIVFSQVQISQAAALAGFTGNVLSFGSGSSGTGISLSGDPTKDALSLIPHGTRFYSEKLGISFDDPIRSLEVIAQLDPAYGRNKVQLSQSEMQRYIRIGTTHTMGCEFCCGADTAVTGDGRPTCGCKHSWATRGLMAYLIKNYPQLSDDEIMHSLAEWKVMFFPRQMVQRYIQESQTGQYTPDIRALLLDANTGSVKSAKESNVPVASSGNTQAQNNVPADLNNLPSQVGGC